MSRHARRLVSALVLAVAAAFAAPLSAGASPIDPDATGSLTIHKYLVPEGATIEAGRPAQGVRFAVARVVDVDLATDAGWRKASEIASGDREVGTLGRSVSAVTDASGSAVFQGLALGLYRVTETTPPEGVDPVDPFFVTVPLTDPEHGDQWLYDVHVYPKNVTPTDSGHRPPRGDEPPADDDTTGIASGGDTGTSGTKQLQTGVTGAETGMLAAIALCLIAVGAWLAVLVGRLRRRSENQAREVS